MTILDWWNGLSVIAQVFYYIAIPATVVLVVQTVLMFIGFGNEEGELDGGFDDDLDGDVPEDVDASSAFEGLDGLRVFTIRGIVAFFVVFGWLGVSLERAGVEIWLNVIVSVLAGFLMMLTLAWIMRATMKLRSNGNADNRNTIGTAGKVQLVIPANRSGEGKVHVMLQGTYVERNAVTDENEPIPTGAEIVVVGVSGQTDLVVKRK